MTTTTPLLATTLAFLWIFAPAAFADPIGPDCGSCQGSIYTLLNLGQIDAPGGTTDEYHIDLRINTAGYDGGGAFIDSVAIKVSSHLSGTPSSSLVDFLVDGVHSAAVTSWTVQSGGLNNAGCSGSGGGFECARDFHSAPVPGATYDWIFDVVIPAGTLITATDGASIKARYVDTNGEKIGALMSEDITLQDDRVPPTQHVPEPASLALVASGLISAVAWAAVRRR